MADITSITTAITAVKTAIEITKTISDIDKDFEKSELKLKIIELRDSLFNAKNELLDVKELIQEKDEEIKKLRNLLEKKENSHVEVLSEECVKILDLLSKVPSYEDGLIASQISYHTQIPEPKTEYLLDLLKEKEFVRYVVHTDFGTQYNISKNGRKYLFEDIRLN